MFLFLDAFVNTFFTIEFIARLIVSYDRVAFCKDVFNMFDFVAILPFYIDFFIAGGVPFLRLARMLRIFKVSKVRPPCVECAAASAICVPHVTPYLPCRTSLGLAFCCVPSKRACTLF